MLNATNVTDAVTIIWNENYTSTVQIQQPIQNENMGLIRIICEVWVSFPIAVLGILGNIMAFVVLCRQQKLTTTVLLQALAVADTLVLVSTVLLRSMRYMGWAAYNNIYHYIFVSLYPCVYFFRLADTWLTVMLTIDRYIAVCHPLKAQRICTLRRTYLSITVILISTFLFSLPRFFENKPSYEETGVIGFVHTTLLLQAGYTLGYRVFLFFIVMYLIPMALLIVLNVRLMCTLRQSFTHRSSMISRSENSKTLIPSDHRASASITVIVGTVVTVCVLCNVTAITSHILWSLQLCIKKLYYLEYHRRFLANASNVLVTFNSAINFVIYCMFSRKFRAGLRDTCNCCGMTLCCHETLRRQSSSGTVTTSYSSMFPLRVSIKNRRLTIQRKSTQDI